ncbi:unnamed protein product [Blumeria hordei]|uniref:Nudix hydrolase domain-containing protein n=1 Tax=Blumeria hordei TaxID=2867405 RepID=A0A383UZY0_BLUHO|nr:unnamed protein product [Blumeria hordei]
MGKNYVCHPFQLCKVQVTTTMVSYTFLDYVNECDAFPYPDTSTYDAFLSIHYTLLWNDTPIGYVTDSVIQALGSLPSTLKESIDLSIDHHNHQLSILQKLQTSDSRTAAVAALCDYWRQSHTFEVLLGWRDELYPVYGPGNEILWSVERSASSLFGIVSYGVHMTAYTIDKNSEYGIKIWVPRRSMRKQTFGGMLDNTVAGGIATGELPLESLVREANEEAGLEEFLVRKHAKAWGTVSYIYIRDARAGGEVGLIQPECQYVYDIELPGKVIPVPVDGEVEQFYLWSVAEVQAALTRGEFKPNCALVMLDFFLRWSILTQDNGTCSEIRRRIHRKLEFPGPHQLISSTQ